MSLYDDAIRKAKNENIRITRPSEKSLYGKTIDAVKFAKPRDASPQTFMPLTDFKPAASLDTVKNKFTNVSPLVSRDSYANAYSREKGVSVSGGGAAFDIMKAQQKKKAALELSEAKAALNNYVNNNGQNLDYDTTPDYAALLSRLENAQKHKDEVDPPNRLQYGLRSIGQTLEGALPVIADTAIQAGKDFSVNIQNPQWRKAAGKVIRDEILGDSEPDEWGIYRGLSDKTVDALNDVSQNTVADKNSAGNQLLRQARQSQEKAVEGLSPTGQLIGNTLISVGQNAVLLPTAMIHPAIPLVGMGTVAAAGKMHELTEQDIAAGEALARGIIAGGIEIATEKMPLDSLFKIAGGQTGRTAIKNILSQMGTEASEETVSYVANYIADKAANDPNAQFSLQEMALAAAGGGLSGGIMGGPAAVIGAVNLKSANAAQTARNASQSSVKFANEIIPAQAQNAAQGQNGGTSNQQPDLLKGSGNSNLLNGIDGIAEGTVGLVDNAFSKRLTRRTRRAIDAAGKAIGSAVVFDNDMNGDNGYYDPERKIIRISAKSKDPLRVVMTHEITHRLKETSPELYNSFRDAAANIMRNNGTLANVLYEVQNAYGKEVSAETIEDEAIAHFTRRMTEDIGEFEKLVGVNRNVAQKLLDAIDEFIHRAGISWNDLGTADDIQDMLFGDMSLEQLKAVRAKWADALKNADAAAQGSGAQMQSIETIPGASGGMRYVKADRQIVQGNDPALWKKQVANFLEYKIRRGDDVVIFSSDGHPLIIGEDTVAKAVYDRKNGGRTILTPEEFKRKVEAASHVDELAQISRYNRSKPDNPAHEHDDVLRDWKYFTAHFMDADGKYYDVEFSVKPAGKDIIYDIGTITKRKFPANTGSSSANGGAHGGKLLNDTTVAQNLSGVNNQSMQQGKNNSQVMKSKSLTDDKISDSAGYVAFSPEQIKRIDNIEPTENPDIRYSKPLNSGTAQKMQEQGVDMLALLTGNAREAYQNIASRSSVNNSIPENGENNSDMLAPLEMEAKAKREANIKAIEALNEQQGMLKKAQHIVKKIESNESAASVYSALADNSDISDISKKLVDNASAVDNSLANQYAEIRNRIKNTKYALSEQDVPDLGEPVKDFSRRTKIKFSVDGTPVDAAYIELSEMAPELFPDSITHPADQVKRIAEVMQETAPQEINPYESDLAGAYEYASGVINDTFSERLKTTPDSAAPSDADNYLESLSKKYGTGGNDLFVVMSNDEYNEFNRLSDEATQKELGQLADEIAMSYDFERQEQIRQIKDKDLKAKVLENLDDDVAEGKDLSDVAPLINDGMFYNLDISRVLDKAATHSKLKTNEDVNVRNKLYEAIEKPLNEAKAKYTNAVTTKANDAAAMFDRLGIKAGSKESAAVQWYGEGLKPVGDELAEYTLADLKSEFPDTWSNIVAAADYTRAVYDKYISEVNAAKMKIYPHAEQRFQAEIDKANRSATMYAAAAQQQQAYIDAKRAQLATVEAGITDKMTQANIAKKRAVLKLENAIITAEQTAMRLNEQAQRYSDKASELARQLQSGEALGQKRLVPRKDYFHHFQDMAEGFGGLANILNTPNDIASSLAGTSEYTKPKRKWWGALEHRNGGAYTADAVKGLAKYIPAAEYAVNIDPYIAELRGTIQKLTEATAESKNANRFIKFLTDYANDLAGKTNPADRFIQDIVGRKPMKVLQWFNNRAKSNAVMGNLGSAIVQIGNIPNAMIYIPNPVYWAQAADQGLKEIVGGKKLTEKSAFLKERYLGNALDKLDNKSFLRKGTEGLMEFGDREAAKLIWRAAYNQFRTEGARRGMRDYASAVDYADDITRRSIAGRGIGEIPLTQKSKLVGLFAPFQVEVNNTFHVLADALKEKDAAGMLMYAVTAWLINSMIYAIRGSRPLFDPIDAVADAVSDIDINEKSAAQNISDFGMRLSGEVVGNLPYAATAATIFAGADNSEKLFGENDPTRYGTGNIAVQSMLEPLADFASGKNIDLLSPIANFALPYGGKQVQRAVNSAVDYGLLPKLNISRDGVSVSKNEFPAAKSTTGLVQFPLEPRDMLKNLAFGKWATDPGKAYITNGSSPMSEKQSAAIAEAVNQGISASDYYKAYLAQKKAEKEVEDGKTVPLSKDKERKRLVDEALKGMSPFDKEKVYKLLGISEKVW